MYYLYVVLKQTGTGSKILDYMKYKRLINHRSILSSNICKDKKKISSDLTIETWCLISVFIKYDSLFVQVSTKTFRLKLYLLHPFHRWSPSRSTEPEEAPGGRANRPQTANTRGSLARRRRWLRYECLSDLEPWATDNWPWTVFIVRRHISISSDV